MNDNLKNTLPLLMAIALVENVNKESKMLPAKQAVLSAQDTADQTGSILADAKAAVAIIEEGHKANLHKVFAARCAYLADLLEELAAQDPAYRLGSLIGDTPFTIHVIKERLSFGLVVNATGEEHNTFDNVEKYLLNLLK